MTVDAIEWRVSDELVPYPEALAAMEARAAAIRAGAARELIWLLEHPPLYTAGTSADPAELFNPEGFPVYAAGRGGRYTYHGPGQPISASPPIARPAGSASGWTRTGAARPRSAPSACA